MVVCKDEKPVNFSSAFRDIIDNRKTIVGKGIIICIIAEKNISPLRYY